ncbi:FecR domain-containing protein [Janthinobacterium sp. NFX145]|uniref:FecR domain-containing protein n=1 Tax=Janthinobacterium sp. NFX145 TaxID=3415602 RepID=UPI003CC50A46
MHVHAPVPASVLDQAIAWQLLLGSGTASAADRHGLQTWLEQAAEHAQAWRQLGQIDQHLAPASGPATRTLLLKRGKRRLAQTARVAAATALAVMLAAGIGSIHHVQPLDLLADYRTGTGERRSVLLPDGSVLHLNTGSAVDLAFDSRERGVMLRSGEIAIDTSHSGNDGGRPFIVHTPDGSLRALGTSFIVRRLDEGGTRLTVTRFSVAARPASCAPQPQVPCAQERIVGQGETVRLHDGVVGLPAPADGNADAWKDGMLVVENQPLGAVVAEIARYHHGYLHVTPEAARLRVSGALPLGNSNAALLALSAAVPVEVSTTARWWSTVRLRDENK